MKLRICSKILLCLICICSIVVCTACSNQSGRKEAKKQKLILWYSDENMKTYLEAAAKQYEQQNAVAVTCEYHDSKSYLEDIYDASMDGKHMPDLYLLRHDKLGRACMEGLAAFNASELYNEEHYCPAALLSAQYQGRLMAYPLCFDTVCMIYNTQSFQEAPATMGAITAFSQTEAVGENVQNILYWDINDYFVNSSFVEAYMDIGGEAGDDDTVLSVANEDTGACLSQFQFLNQYFAVDVADVSKEDVPMAFVEGRALCILADAEMLKMIDWYDSQGMGVDYELCAVPNLDDTHKSCSASYTQLAVVNGFSLRQEQASEFAQFLTYEYTDKLYSEAGCFAARRGITYENPKLSQFYAVYEQSRQFPKLPQTEDLQVSLELLFDNVKSGSNFVNELVEFSQRMELRMHKETS